jgi:UDP-N-acetylmuramoylalanine--D-glutamate ligase
MSGENRPPPLRRRPRPPLPPGPYLVVGLGQAGQAAVEALCRVEDPGRIVASDSRPSAVPKRIRRRLREADVRLEIGVQDDVVKRDPRPGAVVRSPGVPMDAPLFQRARSLGIEVIDELELGWRLLDAPMVGVTGTNGKTTTATLAATVLGRSGLSTQLAGNADIAPALSTLTGRHDAIVCEVSSFQLEGCTALLPEVGVFTNLSHDHLPRHGSMERYGEVKRSMFLRDGEVVALAVIDTIDDFGRRLADEVEAAGGRAIRVGEGSGVEYRIEGARWDMHSAEVELATPSGGLVLRTRLPGRHNARNVAAVTALSDALGLERETLVATLAVHPGPQGRFEHVDCGSDGPDLILDTAGTPHAVEQFLQAARVGMGSGGRLHTVLGVLGGPDPEQRRAMGRASRELSDVLVLTSGSFRENPPVASLETLLEGAHATAGGELVVEPRREAAIARALSAAAAGDVVAVLGRGNVVEAVSARKFDDRTTLRRLALRRSRLPEGGGQAATGELGMELKQR